MHSHTIVFYFALVSLKVTEMVAVYSLNFNNNNNNNNKQLPKSNNNKSFLRVITAKNISMQHLFFPPFSSSCRGWCW